MSRARTESSGDSACPVCHEHTEIFAIGPCDHPICYRCSTRMRVLCDQTYCPICRGELPQIVFLTSKQKYDAVERRSCIPNRKFKILLEDECVEDAFDALLEHHCQVCDTRPRFDSFQALQTHMNRTHTLFACDLCVKHLKIFPFERKFYNRKDLAIHRRKGDPDNRSYRGHPLCDFCDDRFMDNDELLRHLRKFHYYCHFCDASSSSNEYFNEYRDLKIHFQARHYLCEEGECGAPEAQFTHAFASEIDLKAHVASVHMGSKSKAEGRVVRNIDTNFHMAPRRRGRDAGVVTPDDFQEVNESNRGPRDRGPRDRRPRRYESSRNDNPSPVPEREAPPPNPEPPVLDDFPTLGNCPPPFVAAAAKPAQPVEDFPSLATSRPGVTSSSLISAAPRSSLGGGSQKPVNHFSSLASAISSSGPSRPVSAQSHPVVVKRPAQTATTTTKQSWSAPRLASGEDFPSLGGERRSTNGPNLLNMGGAWSSSSKPKKNNPRPAASKRAESPPYNPMTSLASLGQSLCDDNDFPSLGGGSAPKQATWVQKNAKSAKAKPGKSTPLGNCLNSSSNNKSKDSENVPWHANSESNTTELKSKKKKKKQKEKEQEVKKTTEDSGISLSSIAGEIDTIVLKANPGPSSVPESSSLLDGRSDTPSPSDQLTSPSPVANGPSESETWETVVGKKSVGFQEDDFPSLSALPKKSTGKSSLNGASSAEKNKQKNKPTASIPFQDDFPALSAGSDRDTPASSSQAELVSEKRNQKKEQGNKKLNLNSLMDDDFPSLHAEPKQTRPPPGFAKAASMAAPPPGLGACPAASGKCPPGLTSTACTATSQPAIPMSVKLNMYPYMVPHNEKERNAALVTQIRKLLILKDGGLDEFRALSGGFRSGQTSAQTYHRTCKDLFGEEKFLQVLPELLAMLPDILKQHELAEAHRNSILGMCCPLNLATCPTCFQYLKVEDAPYHYSTHTNLGQDIAACDFSAAGLCLKT